MGESVDAYIAARDNSLVRAVLPQPRGSFKRLVALPTSPSFSAAAA